MTDNTGSPPLPRKSTGEGGVAKANVSEPKRGKNGQGEAGLGERKQPIHAGGISGHGSKTHNNVPQGH